MSVASLLLILFVLSSLFCVGLVGFAHNISVRVRVYFTLASLSLVAWLTCLYLSNISFSHTLAANRLVYVGPIFAVLAFGRFLTSAFTTRTHVNKQLGIVSFIIAIPLAVIAVLPWNVRGVTARLEAGKFSGYTIVTGPLSPVVIAGLLSISVLLVMQFRSVYRHADKNSKKPLLLVLVTVGLVIVINTVSDLLVPVINGGSSIANVASNLSTLLLVIVMSYSLLRYSLLNTRVVVVRAVAYAFTLLLLTLFYFIPVVIVITKLFNIQVTTGKLFIFLTLCVLFSVMYVYLKRFFVELSTKLFFRNYYDIQDVVDELGGILARTTSLAQLQEQSAAIIMRTLKPSYARIILIKDSSSKSEQSIRQLFKHKQTAVVITDELKLGNRAGLPTYILENGIGAIAVLRRSHQEIGYILIGHKKSGNNYSTQDKRLLSIVSGEIAISIQNALHFEEIQNFNRTLQAKVVEATRQLQRSNQKLQELDETKDEFITMASHQLRTPLTSIKGYLSMVLEGDVGKLNAQQTQMLTQSFASAQRMVYLISDLLNLSRLGTGKFLIEPTPVDLKEIVQSEIDQLRETAKARDVLLQFDAPDVFPSIMLDETKIHQVVMNLIDNAIYYTSAGGSITVSLLETPTAIEYRVQDTGIGVPRAEQHKLFTKFYRAQNAQAARPDGTGIGLFMAKKVVVAQGGSIVFESEEGKGSTFGFRFTKSHHLAHTE